MAAASARPSLVLPARADTDMARPGPTEARARKGRCGHRDGGDASDWPAILRRPSAARLGPAARIRDSGPGCVTPWLPVPRSRRLDDNDDSD